MTFVEYFDLAIKIGIGPTLAALGVWVFGLIMVCQNRRRAADAAADRKARAEIADKDREQRAADAAADRTARAADREAFLKAVEQLARQGAAGIQALEGLNASAETISVNIIQAADRFHSGPRKRPAGPRRNLSG